MKQRVTVIAVMRDEVASALSISIFDKEFTIVFLTCEELYMASDPFPNCDPARNPDPASKPPATKKARPVTTGMMAGVEQSVEMLVLQEEAGGLSVA